MCVCMSICACIVSKKILNENCRKQIDSYIMPVGHRIYIWAGPVKGCPISVGLFCVNRGSPLARYALNLAPGRHVWFGQPHDVSIIPLSVEFDQ